MSKHRGGFQKNRQGIRTLDHIKGPSVGRKLDLPPEKLLCNHKNTIKTNSHNGSKECTNCHQKWDRFDREIFNMD